MLLAVSRPASTIRRMMFDGTGLSRYLRTASTVCTASKTSIASPHLDDGVSAFGPPSIWLSGVSIPLRLPGSYLLRTFVNGSEQTGGHSGRRVAASPSCKAELPLSDRKALVDNRHHAVDFLPRD